jgi:hypothetical protein
MKRLVYEMVNQHQQAERGVVRPIRGEIFLGPRLGWTTSKHTQQKIELDAVSKVMVVPAQI